MDPQLSGDQRNFLERLSEEYAARRRKGEAPDIEDYAAQYPELADDIREIFPVMVMLDCAKDQMEDETLPASSSLCSGGTRLGDYHLGPVIGRGGMGVVHQAEHVLLGNSVAIKLLSASLDRPQMRERFLREASAAARMNHPNIIRVFDFGSHENTLYFVMPLVEGCGLHELLSCRSASAVSATASRSALLLGAQYSQLLDRSLTPIHVETEVRPFGLSQESDSASFDANSTHVEIGDETEVPANQPLFTDQQSIWTWVADLGTQAADALDYAHNIGIIHRDIKPSNLMLNLQGNVMVMDFGLAKVVNDQSLTGTGDVLGTLRYLAPEGLNGQTDARSDIYGLGLTLYELLCGEPAFARHERGKLIRDISQGNLQPLKRRVPKIPADLEKVIHKSIHVDPTSRYQTAGEMRDDLQRFLNGHPVSARYASLSYRASRWVARNRVVSAMAGGLILFLAIAAFVANHSSNSFRRLAMENDSQKQAALRAERKAKVNLLSAKLSDARGWSTSRRPGQRVEGMSSLSEAIALARELDLLNEHQREISEIATTLATLHDIPPRRSLASPFPAGQLRNAGLYR